MERTRSQFIKIIQNELRRETGLLLNRQNNTSMFSPTENISIPTRLVAGVPQVLKQIDIDPEYLRIAPLIPYRPLLLALTESGQPITDITRQIDAHLGTQHSPTFHDASRDAEALLELLDQQNPLKQILGINEDTLGEYDYSNPHKPIIRLYWAAIGIVANLLSIRPEALLCIVLIHELAHGYSHLGMDIDGDRWDSQSFSETEIALKEGIAQYYTHLVCSRLDSRMPGVFEAFQEMMKHQHEVYRSHLDWVVSYSPEIVRSSVIEARHNQVRRISEFNGLLSQASERLGDSPKTV